MSSTETYALQLRDTKQWIDAEYGGTFRIYPTPKRKALATIRKNRIDILNRKPVEIDIVRFVTAPSETNPYIEDTRIQTYLSDISAQYKVATNYNAKKHYDDSSFRARLSDLELLLQKPGCADFQFCMFTTHVTRLHANVFKQQGNGTIFKKNSVFVAKTLSDITMIKFYLDVPVFMIYDFQNSEIITLNK